MIRRFIRLGTALSSVAVALATSLSLTACGGGGGGGGGGGAPPGNPPTGLSYATPVATYEAKVAIAANTPTVGGGAVTSYSVSPSLPTGILLDTTTGVISGTPTAATAQAIYQVTATNADGSTNANVDLTVTLNRADDLSAQGAVSDDDIRYFLGRTQFGAKTADLAAVKAVGIPAWVDQMVEYGFDSAFEATAAGILANTNDPVNLPGGFPSTAQVARYWMYLMINTTTPFQEVMAMFWHDHFASSTTPLESSATKWMRTQITLWRQKGNGNLRQLLKDMTRDYVMLRWLDGVSNSKQAPNENFAREFWELFTLGVDNGYTQADIVEAARAFTGYRDRFDAVTNQEFAQFDTTLHDPGSKTFFGQTIAAQNTNDGDYDRVVDITVDNRPVAEFISKKLYSYFCNPNPSTLVIDTMAAMLRTNGYELKPLLKALFKSKAFFCPASRAGIVKNPVEHVIGFIRSTGLVPIDNKVAGDPAAWPQNTLRTLDTDLTTAAQRPTQPPTVNGWPIGDEWLSSQNMLDRGNAILDCIRDRTDQTNAGILVTSILPAGTPSAAQVVDALTDLLHVTATAAERQTYIDYLNSAAGAGGVPTPSTFDVTNATHVSERVRGLLYMLTQHPTYAVR